MGIYYNPKSSVDGLILALDAGNLKSYSGSGNIWLDLSGVVGNTSIINAPSFSTDSFSFNGTNQYAQTPSYAFGTNGITMEIIYRTSASDTHSEYGRILDWGDTTMSLGTYNSNEFRCWVNAGGSRNSGEFSVLSNTTGFYNNWHHAVMTYDKSVVKGYWDNIEKFSVAKTGDLESGSKVFQIANGDGNYFGGDIAVVRVYNRALLQSEIDQNFYLFKNKFQLQ